MTNNLKVRVPQSLVAIAKFIANFTLFFGFLDIIFGAPIPNMSFYDRICQI